MTRSDEIYHETYHSTLTRGELCRKIAAATLMLEQAADAIAVLNDQLARRDAKLKQIEQFFGE